MNEIAPRLRATIPRVVKQVGAEDAEELIQDGMAIAAQMLDSAERNGKAVTAGNVSHYVILHLKSGRRSQSGSRTDAMAGGTQLDSKSAVVSVEEEVGHDPELDEPVCLGSLLCGESDDPSKVAERVIDWEQFLGAHDYRYGVIARDLASGKTVVTAAKECGISYWEMAYLKRRMAEDLREFLGADAIADCMREPAWAGTVQSEHKKVCSRPERAPRKQGERFRNEVTEALREAEGGW